MRNNIRNETRIETGRMGWRMWMGMEMGMAEMEMGMRMVSMMCGVNALAVHRYSPIMFRMNSRSPYKKNRSFVFCIDILVMVMMMMVVMVMAMVPGMAFNDESLFEMGLASLKGVVMVMVMVA